MNNERANNFTRTKSICLLRGKSDTNFHNEKRILNDIEFNRRRLKRFTNKNSYSANANEYVINVLKMKKEFYIKYSKVLNKMKYETETAVTILSKENKNEIQNLIFPLISYEEMIDKIKHNKILYHKVKYIFIDMSNIKEYYYILMNILISKIKKYFVNFLLNTKSYLSIRLVKTYLSIKTDYLNFYYPNGEHYTKFNSSGDFLFEQINKFASLFKFSKNFSIFKKKILVWKNFNKSNNKNKLCSYLKIIFNTKLSKWKNKIYQSISNEKEICRICDKTIFISDYYAHIFHCVYSVINFKLLYKINISINDIITKIKSLLNVSSFIDNNYKNINDIINEIIKEQSNTYNDYYTNYQKFPEIISLISNLMDVLSQSKISFLSESLIELSAKLIAKTKIVCNILTVKELKSTHRKHSRYHHNCKLINDNISDVNIKENKDSIKNAKRVLDKENEIITYKVKKAAKQLKRIINDDINKSKFALSSYRKESNKSTQETTIEIYPSVSNENDYHIVNMTPSMKDFSFIHHIAKGGYGSVDLYKKKSTNDKYAVKTISMDLVNNKEQIVLLQNETKIFNEINSEHIVKCYYTIMEEENFYFVTEYMPGRDLLSFLNSTVLPFSTIQLIAAEVLMGIIYLHSKNIIHKDIKPENVVISINGHFKLTDFGISEIFNGEQSKNKFLIDHKIDVLFDRKLSLDSTISSNSGNAKKKYGTLYYMAPEQLNEEDTDSNIDFWAYGVLLYELFTVRIPFEGKNQNEIEENIKKRNVTYEYIDNVTDDYTKEQIETAKDFIGNFLCEKSIRWNEECLDKIKKHNFFKNFDFEHMNRIKDFTVLNHVRSTMLKLNNEIKQSNSAKLPKRSIRKIAKENKEDFYTERIDNIFKKCNEAIKKRINNIKVFI